MVRRWSIIGGVVLGLAVAGFTLPASRDAQPENCGGCGAGDDGNGTFSHKFGGGSYMSGAPNSIHYNWQPGWCESWHYYCAGARSAQHAVIEALAVQDQQRLKAVVGQYPGVLSYDPRRSEVIVRCPYSSGDQVVIAVDSLDMSTAS